RLRSRGLLTGAELAAQFKVSQTTIHQWGRQGLLRRQVYGHDVGRKVIMVLQTLLWVGSTLSRMVWQEKMRWTAWICTDNCLG
ncbi:hypothetical protein, partial [Burkholderia anthina]|uniref:hypothetical protein n=1 Tax=Burkholderia anthina TaxID=179879 RepID=UPI001FC8CDDA